MSLFDRPGRSTATPGQQPQQGRLDPRLKLQELQAHPAATLAQAGFNIPPEMTAPQEIINYLLESGQVNQGGFARAIKMLGSGRPGPRR